jgi:hypothetical protein
MTSSTSNRRARLAAVVNGLLVFVVPAGFMLVVLLSASGQSWPNGMPAHRPTTGRVVLELIQFGLVMAALAGIAAWRTWVHALLYQSGASRGWQGVGEAAAVGCAIAVLYLAQGIVTRPREAPPYVIVYGSAAAILGAIVGLVLRLSATVVLRFSQRRSFLADS